MQQVEYRQEGDSYAVYLGDHRVFETDEIALLLNKNGFGLVNHGPPCEVNRRHAQLMRGCARKPELADFSENLVVISGQFDVDSVNRVIQGKESGRALYVKLELAAARQAQDVLARAMRG
jgi:hypothetical protein